MMISAHLSGLGQSGHLVDCPQRRHWATENRVVWVDDGHNRLDSLDAVLLTECYVYPCQSLRVNPWTELMLLL